MILVQAKITLNWQGVAMKLLRYTGGFLTKMSFLQCKLMGFSHLPGENHKSDHLEKQ